ncbi:transcription factor GTE4-like isoform X1 [Phragmites australis]|uniref:transcription factor GTE4-like isoform X1 n=1 Tax=Phragmites australis TaxID=29695 RepID=UPI002D76FE0A|nr:transcription factor GTE4-like isoform X1 [Phragmites australis]
MASGPPSPSGKAYSRKSHGPNASSKAPGVPSFDAHNDPLLPTVTFSLPSTPASRRELRRRLSAELAQVRAASKRLNSLQAPAPSSALSATDPSTPLPPHPSASKHKSKKGGAAHPPVSAEARRKLYAPVFKNCAALLGRLMKHKHSWVFNKPVDASGLGLHDYHTIITKPMDLGTVKSKLAAGHYKSPREFAGDVRLTFQNAMTYNPKGQDVHFMAEQLLNMFEEKWSEIEAEVSQLSPQPPTPSSAAPRKPREIDNSRVLERSDSTVHAAGMEATPKPHTGKPPVLKKPKARDPNKRDMTFWEKQRLSNNLQDLPPEKLDNVVQIIKKRNLSLSQHDDEIEVDIDSFDVETLWELDRFVMNYKKSTTKNKRKAELSAVRQDEAQHDQELEKIEHARQDEADQDQIPTVQEQIPEPEAVDVEPPKENAADDNERYVGSSSSPVHLEDQKGENARSSSSGSSSSDSGSSSSACADTDTDSSSADGSDAAQSPRT